MLTGKILIVISTALELISGQSHRELIPEITAPQQIFWKNPENVIFVKDSDIFEFNIVKRSLSKIGNREPNEFVGLDENKAIILCRIEHFIIDSEDEFSTLFTIQDKELRFFPTIRPISLDGDTIIAMTALDFLEQHYYEISISRGDMKEISIPEATEKGPIYIEEDTLGNVYLNYNARDLLKILFTKVKALIYTRENEKD